MMVSVTRVDVLQPSAQPSDDLKEKKYRNERVALNACHATPEHPNDDFEVPTTTFNSQLTQ